MLPKLIIAVQLHIGVYYKLSKLVNAKWYAEGATQTGLGFMILSDYFHIELGILDYTSKVILQLPKLTVPTLIEVRIINSHFMLKEPRKVLDRILADRISLSTRGVEESFHFCCDWPSRVSSLIMHG